MKSIGIVRRMDDVGRIAIPKEIRNVKGFEGGTPIEIFLDDNNDIVLKRYVPSKEEQINIALENALDFLENMPSPPMEIVEEIQKALEME